MTQRQAQVILLTNDSSLDWAFAERTSVWQRSEEPSSQREVGCFWLDWAVYGWTHLAPEFKNSHYYKVVEQLVRAGAIVHWEWIDNPNRGSSLGAKLRGNSRMMAASGFEK